MTFFCNKQYGPGFCDDYNRGSSSAVNYENCSTWNPHYINTCESSTCAEFRGCKSPVHGMSLLGVQCSKASYECRLCREVEYPPYCGNPLNVRHALGFGGHSKGDRMTRPVQFVMDYLDDSAYFDDVDTLQWNDTGVFDDALFQGTNGIQMLHQIKTKYINDGPDRKSDLRQKYDGLKKRVFRAHGGDKFADIADQFDVEDRLRIMDFLKATDFEDMDDTFLADVITPDEAQQLPNGTFGVWASQDRAGRLPLRVIRNATGRLRREIRKQKLKDLAAEDEEKAIAYVCGEYEDVCPLSNGRGGVVIDLDSTSARTVFDTILGNSYLRPFLNEGKLHVQLLEGEDDQNQARRRLTSDSGGTYDGVRIIADADTADAANQVTAAYASGSTTTYFGGADASTPSASGGSGGSSSGPCEKEACCGAGTAWDHASQRCVATYEGALEACHEARGQWGWTCSHIDACSSSDGVSPSQHTPSAAPAHNFMPSPHTRR